MRENLAKNNGQDAIDKEDYEHMDLAQKQELKRKKKKE